MSDYRKDFGVEVQKALAGRSYRQVAPRVGVSATYIGDMVQGRVPSRAIVMAFAEATGADVDRLLLAAGYAPVGSGASPVAEEWSPLAYLSAELARRAQERGEPLPVVWSPRAQDFTREEADAYLAELDRVLAEEDAANAATD